MKKRTVAYFSRQKAFIAMSHTPTVKSLLMAEFKAAKNIVVKKDILKTFEQVQQMGKVPRAPTTEKNTEPTA